MEGELPDWLAEMRDQQLGQQLEEEEPGPTEQAVEDIMGRLGGQADPGDVFQDQPDPAVAPPDQTSQGDVLEDLREQMVAQATEKDFGHREKPPLTRVFSGLQPWQRFVLAVLLFLDVALCGCMALVMAGRVALPF